MDRVSRLRAHRRTLLVAALLLLGAAGREPPQAGAPVTLRSQPGSALERAARELTADDLAAARARGDKPLLLVGSADLGGERPALFVQMQSAQECGSAGCDVSIFSWENGGWKRVLDGAAGRLSVSTHKTRGRHDILADHDKFVWSGTAYRSIHPVPAVDLRPHPRRR